MQPTVTYTTPDGVARPLRFTFGAMKRIVDRLGCQLGEAFQKYGESCLPDILYCCMYDRDGRPPAGLDPAQYIEDVDPTSQMELLAKLEAACPPGPTKNALGVILQSARLLSEKKGHELETIGTMLNSISTAAGVSPSSASESPTPISGISPSESSTNSMSDGLKNGKSSDFTPV